MNENETGFEDFESALFGGEYQDTDTTADKETNETESDESSDADDEAVDGSETEQTEEEESTPDSEENGAEDEEKPDNSTEEQDLLSYKVNKEERSLNLKNESDRATAKELLQKGSDYDRVKEQSAQRQKTIDELQEKLNGANENQGLIDILSMIADKSKTPMADLVESLYVNFRRSGGASEDAARQELKNAKLEKELNSFKAQKEEQEKKQKEEQEQANDADARFRKDMEEFKKVYPDVTLTEELVKELVPDIKNGLSLTVAYLKHEKDKSDARNNELERKLAAKEQNAKKRRKSPGSQVDSGGRRGHTDADVFERALFGERE